MRLASKLILWIAAAALAACGNPEPTTPTIETPDARSQSASDRYLPLAVGARWTYHAVDPATGATGETESVVEALEDVGGAKAGITAYRIRSTTLTGSTVNWQQDLGTSVVRHREQFFDLSRQLTSEYFFLPNRLRLDESPAHTVVGATWTENHSATLTTTAASGTQTVSFSVQWTVEAVDETVNVPAGTFTCLRVHRVATGYASADETQWFAKHVGKVKETGTEPRDLTSYSVP
jgi:hypothetical protein